MPELLTIDDLVKLKKAGVAAVDRVEIFAAGRHRADEPYWTRRDLARMVKNFSEFSSGPDAQLAVPVVIGHGEEQAWLQSQDLPAAGLVTRLWLEPGGLLAATFADLPQPVADALRSGLYFSVSSEIDDEPPHGIPGSGPTLRRVALLGGQAPALKFLERIPQLRWYSEQRPGGARTYAAIARTYIVSRQARNPAAFQQGTTVDQATKDTLLAVIKGKWPDLPDSFLAALTDEQIQELATAATPAGAAGDGTAAQDMPPREQMISEIIAADPSQDQATLEAMTDEDLFALWQQVTGGTFTEQPMVAANPPAPAPKPNPAPTPAPETDPSNLHTAAAYAEGLRRVQALERRTRAALAAADQRERAERHRAVAAYCERWVRDGYVLPREVDRTAKAPNLYHRLMSADGRRQRKYGETTTTEFESFVSEIEARGANYVRRHFSERIADPVGAKDRKTQFDLIREETVARLAKKAPVIPLERRLGRLPHPGMR